MKTQLPDFGKASVLVVGDIMLDRYWFGDAARISPEAPVPVVKINQVDERPGGAGNVALNIAALGAQVTLMGATGNDPAATKLTEQLTAAHIRTDILRLDTIPTITKLRVISRHQQLLRLDFEEKICAFKKEDLLQRFQKNLNTANLIILSDYQKGTLATPQDFIRLAKKAGIPVLVDPKGNDFSIYRGANIITPNLKEFETIMGKSASEKELIAKAQQFLNQFDIETLLLTRGEQGMTLIERNKEEVHLPAHAREVFDVTGAGDTVIAVLGAAIAAGDSLVNAMTLANLAASLVVAKLGAAAVTCDELQAALHQTTVTRAGILDDEHLLQAVSAARLAGKKIVFTNGCFDILHAGHVTYLQQAKLLGDYLIVAVNDDASVKRLNKGPERPINALEHRMAVLAGLSAVDAVISFADDTPHRLLKYLQPDILVKGGDYAPNQVVGAEVVYAYGGEVRVLGLVKNLSTTSLIQRISRKEICS